MKQDFPDIIIPSLKDFEEEIFSTTKGSFNNLTGLNLEDQWLRLKPKLELKRKTKVGKKKWPLPVNYHHNPLLYEYRILARKPFPNELKMMVFHDSFINAMRQFINPGFQEVVYFRRDQDIDCWDEEMISTEKPDIVLYELSELMLESLLL
jgi:hypothetical protein